MITLPLSFSMSKALGSVYITTEKKNKQNLSLKCLYSNLIYASQYVTIKFTHCCFTSIIKIKSSIIFLL